MFLKMHDGRIIENPSEQVIQDHIFELREPSDFLILRNPSVGEIRVAGPTDELFLVQCDLTINDEKFEGEKYDVSLGELVTLFSSFYSSDYSWRNNFINRNTPYTLFMKIEIVFVLVLFIFTFFYFLITT